jgi:AraC-like DNA-binding protein
MPQPDDPFAVIHGAAEERHSKPDYFHDNASRGDANRLVVQRTVGGTGFFSTSSGRRLVPAGFAFLFTHREPSCYGYPAEATESYRLRYLAFSPSGIKTLFDRLRRDFGAVVAMPDSSEATALFNELSDRFRQRRWQDRLQESELLYRLLIALYREQVHGTRKSDPIEFGYHYVRNHFRSPINLKGVASQCGVSREHFIREFTRRYGEPPGSQLRRLRLEHARSMLTATALPVEEVALASGFTSSNNFCRAYRMRYGKSPGADR